MIDKTFFETMHNEYMETNKDTQIYFALNSDGLLYDVGNHGDWESAEQTAHDMQLDHLWLISESEAKNWAEFILDRIESNKVSLGKL